MLIQDIRAHLNDHIEASVVDHLELTWSSLVVAKQEIDNMKDLRQKVHAIQDANQKLTESVADTREEVRDLSLAVKSLEIQNIQLKKEMEDMARKTPKGLLTESMTDTRKEVRALKFAIETLETENEHQKVMMKVLEIRLRASRSRENAHWVSLQKSIPTQQVIAACPPTAPGPHMLPHEESKEVHAMPESN